MTYRDRQLAKAERLRGWAEKREVTSAADLERARQMASIIPFGQPILVGHHSERGDRAYRGRIERTYERAFESADKAERMAARADGIERAAEGAIYSDDEDAIERLEERIAELEAKRDRIKAENAAFNAEHKAELKTMTAYDRDRARPHAGYELTNLSGNIKRQRDRLAMLRVDKARATRAEEAEGGFTVERQGGDWVSVTFPKKPERAVLDALRGADFRWRRGSWWGRAAHLPTCLTPAPVPGTMLS
jgi:DNA repair exonuclease SbcCD ATPase subunit